MSNVPAVDTSSLINNYIDKHQTSPVGSTSSSTKASPSAATSSSSSLWGDFSTFLKILTTQLQNQDPLNATDTNEFTRQLVQYAGVEQQINTNTKLDKIASSINSNGITPLLGYVGQTVEASANDQIVVQNGVGAFSYTLPGIAQKVTITVKDSGGNTVATMDGSTKSGVNRIAWDTTQEGGQAVADGTYKIEVTAKNSNGEALTVSDINLIGVVTGIQTASNGTATLSVGDVSLEATDVTSVYGAIASSAKAPNSSTSS